MPTTFESFGVHYCACCGTSFVMRTCGGATLLRLLKIGFARGFLHMLSLFSLPPHSAKEAHTLTPPSLESASHCSCLLPPFQKFVDSSPPKYIQKVNVFGRISHTNLCSNHIRTLLQNLRLRSITRTLLKLSSQHSTPSEV